MKETFEKAAVHNMKEEYRRLINCVNNGVMSTEEAISHFQGYAQALIDIGLVPYGDAKRAIIEFTNESKG